MRKIAILTGGVGKGADRLVSLFNDGNRFRVELIVADTTNTEIADRFVGKDVEVVFLPGQMGDRARRCCRAARRT